MKRLSCFRWLGMVCGICLSCALHAQAVQLVTEQSDIHSLRVRSVAQASLALERVSYLPSQLFLVMPSEGYIDGSDENNTLEISFDLFSHDFRHFSYTVQLLNRDGSPSSLSGGEYLRGFTTADIDQYDRSVNTQQMYSHYWFTFPNEDMQLLLSGRYELKIYQDGDPSHVVARVLFSVVEPLTSVDGKVRADTDIEFDGRYQQLDFDLMLKNLNVSDARDISVLVQQNGRSDNQVWLTRPTYVEPHRYRYLNQRALIFEAGNEFRHFDTYSAYYAGYHVDRIRYGQGDYHALLELDEVRGTKARGASKEGLPYITEPDNNGSWLINCEKADYPDIEAEYMWVHWVLPVTSPVMDGNVYVGGDVFDHRFGSANRMQYDPEQMCYYLESYLKQGGYEYQYYVSDRTGKVSLLPIEGSHWQTQNDYLLWVYYHPFAARHDRIVGCFVIR